MSALAEPQTSVPPRKRGKSSRSKAHPKPAQCPPGDVISNSTDHPQEMNVSNNSLVSPLTPPRTTSDIGGVQEGTSNESVPSNKKNGRGRKRTNTKHDGANHVPTRSIPQVPAPPKGQSSTSATPLKQATQMYAGPTFHASPAPSSLPIPKFLSKSMPADQLPTLSSVTSDEESSQESSVGKGGESPTFRNSLKAEGAQVREPSPLDIFFKADREEKARLNQTSPHVAAHVVDRAKSASPSVQSFRQGEARQHTRRQTESPSGSNRSGGEDIQAKTEALKQLLLFPKAQKSSPAIVNSSGSPAGYPRSPGNRNLSGSSTPTRLFPSSKDALRSASSLQDSPSILIQNQRGLQALRPTPSHVRQELLEQLSLDPKDASSKPRYVTPVLP